MDRVETEALCSGYIRLDIVDKDGAVRLDREALDEQSKNARIGFDHPLFARNENASEPAQEFKARPRQRVGLGRPVGESVERRAETPQLGQNLDRAGEGTGDHLVEAAVIGVDQLGLLGMLGLQQSSALTEGAAGILAAVPLMRANRGQKILHPRVVAGEQLAVEVSRVPVDQNAAEVEYHGVIA